MTKFIGQYEETKERSDQFAQSYDRTKIFITKGGKTYNLYDSIQEAREDTEIYPTLEKYGNLQIMERSGEQLYGDLSDIEDLRDLYQKDLKLQEIFDNLPSKERNAFNNDFYQFKQNGLAYYEAKAKAEIKAKQKQNEPTANKTDNGGKE